MTSPNARLVTRRMSLRLLAVAGGATLMAACAPASPAPSATTAPAAAPTQPPAAAKPTVAPAQTGTSPTFRVDEQSDVASLNPLIFNSTPTRRRAVQLFSSLYQYDASKNLVPDIAATMPQM